MRMVSQFNLNLLTMSNIIIIIFTCIFIVVYTCILKNWWYFSKRNINFIRGWPFIGTLHQFFIGNCSFADTVADIYHKFPNDAFIGIYELTYPVFIIRDPELIKQITTKDFEHFLNRQSNFDEDLDSLLARSLFFSCDQRWKDMRTILSVAFTGNKMRMMFDLVHNCTNNFIKTLQRHNKQTTTNTNEFELKDLFSRFMTNVIATTAFGLNIEAFDDCENEFYLAGKKITNFDGIQGVKILLFDIMPKIMKFFHISLLDQNTCNYFRNVVLSAIAYREKNKISRPDMIHLMMEARKGTLHDGDDDVNSTTKKYGKRIVKIGFEIFRIFFFFFKCHDHCVQQ